MQASVEANTVVLRCYLKKEDGTFYRPRLVRLDQLTFPPTGLPFFEDCRTPALVGPAKEGRERWLKAIAAFDVTRAAESYRAPAFAIAHSSLIRHVAGLREWANSLWRREEWGKAHFFAVLTVLFSIARTAHAGRDRNLATRHKGKGAMVAMLNTRLHAEEYAPYAALFEAMLRGTSADVLLASPSLLQHIKHANEEAAQVYPGHPVWEAAAYLFPEVLQPVVREELEALGGLPAWAVPTRPSELDSNGMKQAPRAIQVSA